MPVVREMAEDLMRECLEDAQRLLQEARSGLPSLEAVSTLAAALFEARWVAGVRRLYDNRTERMTLVLLALSLLVVGGPGDGRAADRRAR